MSREGLGAGGVEQGMTKLAVEYIYRGLQEGKPVYSRANEQPYMPRAACRSDAESEGKRAVFIMDAATNTPRGQL